MPKQRQKTDTYLDNELESDSFYTDSHIVIDETIVEGRRRLSRWNRLDIDTSNVNNWKLHRVTAEDRNDIMLISYNYYGRTDYWRAIAQVNSISNPIEDISIGTELYIPNEYEINKALGK